MRGRRIALYFSWHRHKEIEAELGILENRYPTLFEFRRAIWPLYEWASNRIKYNQDISGFLDHVVLFDFHHFSDVVLEATGNPVSLIQRGDNQAPVQEIDEDFLKDIDTLIVISLDHFQTNQVATESEVQAIRHFLERSEACLLICPQHDVGSSDNRQQREIEFYHHGDRTVPSQQRIGGFARSLLAQLGYTIENHYGLSPAKSLKDNSPEPLQLFPDLDKLQILQGVDTFNLHPHLPHFHIADDLKQSVVLLAKQLINQNAPKHPFVDAGNSSFNAFVWIPPHEKCAGNIFVCDATLWSSAFGGLNSLEVFWRNVAKLKI